MGWYGTYKNSTLRTMNDFKESIIKDWTTGSCNKFKVLDKGGNNSQLWLKIQNVEKNMIFVVCHLLKEMRNEFMEKSISINDHPYYYDCPVRFFENDVIYFEGHAKEWFSKFKEYKGISIKEPTLNNHHENLCLF